VQAVVGGLLGTLKRGVKGEGISVFWALMDG